MLDEDVRQGLMRGVGSWDARVRRGCLGLLRVTSASSSSSASTFTAASTAAAVQDAPGPDDILVDGDQLQASTSTSNSNATDATNATNLTRSGHSDKVLEALIKAEDVPISLTGVRERVLKIQRIGSVLNAAEGVAGDVELVAWWLIGMSLPLSPFHVNRLRVFRTASTYFALLVLVPVLVAEY